MGHINLLCGLKHLVLVAILWGFHHLNTINRYTDSAKKMKKKHAPEFHYIVNYQNVSNQLKSDKSSLVITTLLHKTSNPKL